MSDILWGRGIALNWRILIVGLALCVPQNVYAADNVYNEQYIGPSSEMVRPSFALQITPYIWATGLKGEVSPFGPGPTVGVDRSFSDGRDGLNVAGFVNIWGRYERFVLSANVMYTDTTDSDTYRFPGTSQLPAIDVAGSIDTKQFMGTLQGGYRVLDVPGLTLDALGGIRIWHISNEITASGLGRSESYHESFSWVDPVVGSRMFVNLADRLSLQAQADIGGFSVSSDLTWSVLSTVNYTLTQNLSMSAGYKVLDVDYKHHGHVYDVRFSGPVLGVTYRF
ncbi:opacity family porin [Brucella thiophenivorans]|uniref:opacity family porin n=1 Tax=Brucella thiophenivorans TaxID=571255 RepID=UPI001F47B524|nr:opacity family porin [Brucella thiophenivorans]